MTHIIFLLALDPLPSEKGSQCPTEYFPQLPVLGLLASTVGPRLQTVSVEAPPQPWP